MILLMNLTGFFVFKLRDQLIAPAWHKTMESFLRQSRNYIKNMLWK